MRQGRKNSKLKILIPLDLMSYVSRYIGLALILLLLAGTVQLSAQIQNPFFKHLTVEDGLSNNWVKSMIKDQDGFMWFGTFNGLCRYDGKEFKVYRTQQSTNLHDNIIECLAQDQTGKIWIGTFSGGLHVFDPMSQKFVQFVHQDDNLQSPASHQILSITTDQNSNTWIGHDQGLDSYNYETKQWTHYHHQANEESSILKGNVSSLYQDEMGRLWVGTESGLCYKNANEQIFHDVELNVGNTNKQVKNHIKSIYQDKYGHFWIGTWGQGLYRYHKQTQRIDHFKANDSSVNSISNNSILSIVGDDSNHVFIATEGGGLNMYDLQAEEFAHFKPELSNPRSLNTNSIHSLFYDPGNGILWAGTYNGGINYLSKWDKAFSLYQASVQGLNNNHITCVTEDQQGKLWIGTDGGGINVFDEKKNQFQYIQESSTRPKSILSNAVLSVLCDRQNRIWLGTYSGGLDVLDANGQSIAQYQSFGDGENALINPSVSSIYEDRRGNIWVGTMTGGLFKLNAEGNTFTRFEHQANDEQSIIDNFIYGIYEDRFGKIFILTGKGLEIYDSQSGIFERFNPDMSGIIGVPISLLEDSQGNLWVGSQENGLFRIDRTGIGITSYTVQDGLPSNHISGILEDDIGNLWISTQNGMCKFSEAVLKPETKRFLKYSVDDGLQGSEFKRGAFCKRSNGEMVFAGQNGFNIFNPLRINSNPYVPPIKITGLKLFNKEVDFRNSDILNHPISTVESIQLKHHESVVSFEFSALNYLLPEKNQYAYKMEGFEESWNEVGSQSNATYSNLDPGHYVFKVRGSNNDGIWNQKGVELAIIVIPPWWETWYVRSAFIFLFLALIFGFHRLRTYQLKQSKKELERQVSLNTADLKKAVEISEERQHEILRQNDTLILTNQELERQAAEIKLMADEIKALNEAKIKFFTNISHELRTPLNLILWPLEELISRLEDTSGYVGSKYELMRKNANKLIKLINQLLDVRNIETGALRLHLQKADIIPALKETFVSYQDWAQRKEIAYHFVSEIPSLEMEFDADKLDKIISNLLSNAFKFVDQKGHITLAIQQVSYGEQPIEQIRIEVKDDGKGIAKDELKLIFDRFYEGKESRFAGSGIGLSLVKDLTEIHQGRIEVQSELGKGTSFVLYLPTHLVSQENHAPTVYAFERDEALHQQIVAQLEEVRHLDDMPNILLVEDNADIQDLMFQKLKELYHVEMASNGVEGIRLAKEMVPDIIISDIMMPEMDGLSMARELKSDERTSHIPIILLTARSGEENELKGLALGVDDYITKPFHFELLQLKIKNILLTRQKLKAHLLNDSLEMIDYVQDVGKDQIQQQFLSRIQSMDMDDKESKFLSKAVVHVLDNIQNENFNVEDFSQYFGMSRRNVLRKIKGLTGLSINEFIRSIRIKKAHEFLSKSNMNVSEVAYAVGFSDPKYFSLCFKKQYDVLPSELKNQLKTK